MAALRTLSSAIDRVDEVVGEASSWLVLFLVLVTITDVSLRYLFHAGSVAFQELEWHLYAANFLIAAGWTMLRDGHVRIDIFYSRFGSRGQALVDLLGTLLFCIPFCIVVILAARPFFLNAWSIGEGSPDPGGLPARYILKAAIPVGFGIVVVQSISQVLKALFVLTGKEEN